MSLLSSRAAGSGHHSFFLEFLLRRCRPQWWFLLVLFVLGVGGSGGRATTVVNMTFSEVVDGAELIAVGTVSAIDETWDAEREMPFTHVTFSDIEVLKGTAPGAEVTLRFLGGPAPNGLTLEVRGMPRFAVDQQTVVFSAGNGVYACPLVGWWQGLYRVVFDDERNEAIVTDHAWRPVVALDGIVGEREARTLSAVQSPATDALTLDAFKRLIAEELQ